MLYEIKDLLKRPEIYQETGIPFWDDEYISKQMLKSHLDPEFDGASRKMAFIKKSADWIANTVPPTDNPLLLDLGCGPGIYGEFFARAGYQVTGVDFSSRSIDYAKRSAAGKKLNIDYFYQNYLSLELNRKFDLAVMIYCDYGALSTEKRKIVLNQVYEHLKPGGKFLLDAFSLNEYNAFQEKQIWGIQESNGFWREDEYVELKRYCKYPQHVTLDQYVIISKAETSSYYLWNTYYNKDSLVEEVEECGFKTYGIYGDVSGTPWNLESPTIAVILEK
ncbi:MAG: class I SAM-dependent methyltransferase [Hungatella sp.]|nr:class I SAM-dependent methyltransferase [Hungatella sp.]